METDRTADLRRALEALRNGVPNRDAVSILGSNQHDAENAFLQRLSAVHSFAGEGKQVPGLLIAGGFGAGKSHSLDYFEYLAISRNFVCSRVTISKETPFFDPSKVFAAAIDGAIVPGLSGEAIREIALRLEPEGRKYAELVEWANRPFSGLSQVFIATLQLHERLNNDPELMHQISSFWSGEPLSVSRIRQGLKQIDSSRVYSLKAMKLKDLALQRFVFLSRLILAAGYSGWVLLIDEVELVGRYSLLQRGKSYAELARWMGRVEGETYPGLTAVATITDDFGLAVLSEKSDHDKIGVRFRAKGTDEYTVLAGRAETGMRIIERETLTLKAPDDLILADTYQRLKEMHGKAYGWAPPEIRTIDASMRRQMRSYVRRWVNEWDLRRLYPQAELSREEEPDMGPTYDEDESLEEPPGSDE